jgi:hypothetical protein
MPSLQVAPIRCITRWCELQLHAHVLKLTQPCSGSSRCVQHVLLVCRLEETETLLTAQRDVNRGLDRDVHVLMAQLEDLNRRYAVLGRRTAGLQVPPRLFTCSSKVHVAPTVGCMT